MKILKELRTVTDSNADNFKKETRNYKEELRKIRKFRKNLENLFAVMKAELNVLNSRKNNSEA